MKLNLNDIRWIMIKTLKSVDWGDTILKKGGFKETVLDLKQQPGKDIFAGSPSLIVQATQLGLVDEYQLCIHPVIAGSGLPLFKGISEMMILKFLKTKKLGGGQIVHYYEPRG